MDPNAAIENLNDFLDDTSCVDAEDIGDQTEALQDWLAGGGFAPDWTRATGATIRHLRGCGVNID